MTLDSKRIVVDIGVRCRVSKGLENSRRPPTLLKPLKRPIKDGPPTGCRRVGHQGRIWRVSIWVSKPGSPLLWRAALVGSRVNKRKRK